MNQTDNVGIQNFYSIPEVELPTLSPQFREGRVCGWECVPRLDQVRLGKVFKNGLNQCLRFGAKTDPKNKNKLC